MNDIPPNLTHPTITNTISSSTIHQLLNHSPITDSEITALKAIISVANRKKWATLKQDANAECIDASFVPNFSSTTLHTTRQHNHVSLSVEHERLMQAAMHVDDSAEEGSLSTLTATPAASGYPSITMQTS